MSRAREKRRVYEVATTGFDPSLQLRGSGPQSSGQYLGMIIPRTATTAPSGRYLFALAGFSLAGASRARIRGMRQLLTIGATTWVSQSGEPPTLSDFFLTERPVVTPGWRFSDASVSWHLLRVPPQYQMFANKKNASGKMYRYSQKNALLYESLSPYVAPWGGQLPAGAKPVGGLGQFYDVRFPWETAQAWNSLDIPVEGPASYVLFASVWQTDPDTRNTLSTSTDGAASGLPPEENFLLDLPDDTGSFKTNGAVYYRIAGSLIVEEYGGEDCGR